MDPRDFADQPAPHLVPPSADQPTPGEPHGAPLVIPEAIRQAIRQCETDRDRDAHLVGVATLEWLRYVLPRYQHVLKSLDDQRTIGEAALRTAGLDPSRDELRVDLATGSVSRLVVRDGVASYEPMTASEPES